MKTKMILATALLVCVALAGAQGGQGGGQRGGGQGRGGGFGFGQGQGGGQSEMQLVFRQDVQTDLKVTAEQKTKLDELRNRQRPGGGQGQGQGGVRGGGGQGQGQGQGGGNRGQGGGGNRGQGGFGGQMTEEQRAEFAKRMEEQRANQRKELAAILNEGQMKRLDEIRVQLAGARAVTQPDIQKSLGLSTDQVAKINDLQAKQREANMALFQNQDLSQEDRRTRMENNTKVLDTELLKVLTADQNAKLKAMAGQPFKADPQPAGGGRRGGGGN